jgi:hypothetical protein
MSLLISNFFWGDISPLADQKMGLLLVIARIFFPKMAQTRYTLEDSFFEIARSRSQIVFGMVPIFFYFPL